jgi:CHAT domain-containing protein
LSVQYQFSSPQAWSASQYSLVNQYVNALYNRAKRTGNLNKHQLFDILDGYYSLSWLQTRRKYVANVSGSVLPQELKRLWQAKLQAERVLISSSPGDRLQAQTRIDAANAQYYAYDTFDFETQPAAPAGSRPFSSLQQRMPEEDVLIRFYLDQTMSLALIATRDSLQIRELPDRQLIRQWAADIQQQTGSFNSLRNVSGSALKTLLPMDILANKKYKRLVIIPDDVLHRVPFSTLNIASTGSFYKPVSEDFEVIRTHSAAEYYAPLVTTKTTADSNKVTIAVFADPIFENAHLDNGPGNSKAGSFYEWIGELQRLPNTAKEASQIASLFGADKVDIATGSLATNDFLMSERTRNANIMHIATHGFYDPETPDIVGVMTSVVGPSGEPAPGFLSLTEMLSQPFHSQLVVVSGCETMLGRLYKGTGMKSVTHGLLSQGAGSVIGTLWKIPDRSSALFMGHFYDTLKSNGGNSPNALAMAKRKMSEHSRYRDPWYWGGFVLTSTNHHYERIGVL